MFRSFLPVLSAVAVLASTPAFASSWTYAFTTSAGVKVVDDGIAGNSLADAYALLGPLTGRITFDDTVELATPTAVRYAAPVVLVDQFDLAQFERLPIATVIYNDDPVFSDRIASGTQPFDIQNEPNGDYDSLGFAFVDSTQTALSGTGFPPQIVLGDFNRAFLQVASDNLTDQVLVTKDVVRFSFTSFEPVHPVPLPAGLPLLLAGLGALGLMRRRGR